MVHTPHDMPEIAKGTRASMVQPLAGWGMTAPLRIGSNRVVGGSDPCAQLTEVRRRASNVSAAPSPATASATKAVDRLLPVAGRVPDGAAVVGVIGRESRSTSDRIPVRPGPRREEPQVH